MTVVFMRCSRCPVILCCSLFAMGCVGGQDMPATSGEEGVGREEWLLAGNDAVFLQKEEGLPDGFRCVPRAGLSVVWTDNVFLTGSDNVEDIIFTIAPGLGLSIGDAEEQIESWLLADYTANIIRLGNESGLDAVDHHATASARWRLPKLVLGAAARYLTVSGGALSGGDLASTETTDFHIEAGNRDDRETASLGLTARYEFTGKTSLDLGLRGGRAVYEDDLTIQELTGRNWIEWQALPKTRLGLGYTGRHIEPGELPPVDFHEGAVRALCVFSPKFTVEGQAGMLFKHVDAPGGDDVTPTFALRAGYDALRDDAGEAGDAFPSSGWMVDVVRQSYASASFPGQTYTGTDFGVTFLQRIVGRFSMALAVRGRVTTYDTPDPRQGGPHEDEAFYIRPSFIYERAGRLRAEVFWRFFENDSTEESSVYDASALGIRVTMEF